MTPYASNTGTRRNLEALRVFLWRLLLTPDNPTRREGLGYAIDNGAWKAFQQGTEFDAARFIRLVDQHGHDADFIIVPDIVAGGLRSLEFSLSWLPRLRGARLVLPVQDGMDASHIEPVLRSSPELGIFLGGSTEWKLGWMGYWGEIAAKHQRHYHVGRVNTARRIRLAAEAGADSFDGTSATRFSCTLPLLDSARRQPHLFAPK